MLLNKQRRGQLAMDALRTAMRVRKTVNAGMLAPISIFDVADKLGVRVIFKEFKTIEGMYVKGKPASIILTSLRPTGRQAFSCGHELGHHIYGHGDRFDDIIAWGSSDPDEFLVDCFAGHLMMPKSSITNAFTVRGWNYANPEAEHVFVVAGVMGVGYSTLLGHMEFALDILPYREAQALKKVQPKDIRQRILGAPVSEDVVVVDEKWPVQDRCIDIQTGDYVILPKGTLIDKDVAVFIDHAKDGVIYQGIRPGVGRFINSRLDWATYVRVSRRNYTGFALHRYLEDEEFDNEQTESD